MSVITLTCDTCKREIDVRRNPQGLEVVSRCIITLGCRGKLIQTDLHPDFIRGRPTDTLTDLEDWLQRKALFNHAQAIRKLRWSIKHGMGGNPSVQVFVDRPTEEDPDLREEILPDNIIIVSDDELVLEFIQEESGIAQLISRSTDPLLSALTVTSAPAEEIPTQVSTNGTITIVSKVPLYSPPTIIIELVYKNATNNAETIIEEPIDDAPSILSPWVDANQVIIKGKRYVVRSLNIQRPEMANGTITNGAGVRLNRVDIGFGFQAFSPKDFFLLLSKSPFTIVDKDFSNAIDLSQITSINNTFALFFDASEWRATSSIIETIFPLVRIV